MLSSVDTVFESVDWISVVCVYVSVYVCVCVGVCVCMCIGIRVCVCLCVVCAIWPPGDLSCPLSNACFVLSDVQYCLG